MCLLGCFIASSHCFRSLFPTGIPSDLLYNLKHWFPHSEKLLNSFMPVLCHCSSSFLSQRAQPVSPLVLRLISVINQQHGSSQPDWIVKFLLTYIVSCIGMMVRVVILKFLLIKKCNSRCQVFRPNARRAKIIRVGSDRPILVSPGISKSVRVLFLIPK